jgi:transposase
MQVVYERCCGLDVHKKTVVACALTPEGKELRTFGTVTAELKALVTWLHDKQIGVVAMESTGVFWKPIYNLLEAGGFELLVVNAQHMKAVPGRKTDVKDAEWIADLLRHGLLRGSFIPDRAQRELRELVAYRHSLIEERAREANRIQKVLEGANIKLAAVVSNVLGVSGRQMLDAIVQGEEDPMVLAKTATTRLSASQEQLEAALTGEVGAHQRLLLTEQLRHVDFLSEVLGRVDREITERLRPFQEAVERLDRIPGVGIRTAQEIVAIIGTDMSRFPTHRHLASWAKLCPGLKESAGKRSPVGTGKGNPYLRSALIEAAKAAGRTKNTYLASQYHRLAARRGKNRAAVAVAHTILVIVYHMLKEGTPYQDLGPQYFDERDKAQIIRRSVARIEALGKHVVLEDAA